MSYTFSEPEHQSSDEEKKLEVLRYLSHGCWLADVVRKDATNFEIITEYDHPAFFTENNPWFDYPEVDLLNEMVRDGLLSVHVSPWGDGNMESPHYNMRYFRLTGEGRRSFEEHSDED
jgi:hypothetical protein